MSDAVLSLSPMPRIPTPVEPSAFALILYWQVPLSSLNQAKANDHQLTGHPVQPARVVLTMTDAGNGSFE